MLPAHLTCGVLIAATALLFFFSLKRLGTAEAITLSFIAPLLIPSTAIPMVLLSPAAVGAPLPTAWALGLAVLTGLLGNVGIQVLARACAAAEAQALGVLEFTALPWAALFGWLCFGEAVRPHVWVGAAVIFAACWWVGRAERQRPGDVPALQ
jgi:S-adenosylmethionine uptake transporter